MILYTINGPQKLYHNIHQLLKKTQKHANNQRGSSGSIPSIEITKENVDSGDYVSDESEYQEGGNGERDRRASINNNGPPSPLPSYAQHQSQSQSPQHHYQVRWTCFTRTLNLFFVTTPVTSFFRLPVYL